jgi:hypothetical protein
VELGDLSSQHDFRLRQSTRLQSELETQQKQTNALEEKIVKYMTALKSKKQTNVQIGDEHMKRIQIIF